MIRRDQNKAYVLICDKDIITGLRKAWSMNNELMIKRLNKLFNEISYYRMIDDTTYHRIRRNNKLVTFLRECADINDYETYIDHNVLKDAYIRACYEFSHEEKKKLYYYLRTYLDNEKEEIDNSVLKQEILNDKLLLKYIKKYNSLDQYIIEKTNENNQLNEQLKGKNKQKVA